MYPVSARFRAGLDMRASEVTSALAGASLGEVPVGSGTLSWTSDGRKVSSSLSLEVADERGTLVGQKRPLGHYGQRLVVRSGVRRQTYEEMIPCGQYLITTAGDRSHRWADYGQGRIRRYGSGLKPQATDLLSILEADDLVGYEQPLDGATVRSEIIRLVGGRLPVGSWAGVDASRGVGASITYDRSRLGAICSLAALVDAVVWVGRAGELQLLPQPTGSPVWTARATEIADIVSSDSRDGIYNRLVVEATSADGSPLRGIADEITGPFAVDGPYGVSTYTHNNPLATDQLSATLMARTMLEGKIRARAVVYRVTVPADPSLNPLDLCQVTDPEGRTYIGPAVACEMPLEAGVMRLNLAVPRSGVPQ